MQHNLIIKLIGVSRVIDTDTEESLKTGLQR